MSIRKKLTISFLTASLFMVAIGIIAIWSNHRIITQVEFKHKHFRSIINGATNISTLSKKAESNLLFYLIFHDPVNKKEYSKRLKSLSEEIDKITGITDPKGKEIVRRIIETADKFVVNGKTLINLYEKNKVENQSFSFSEHHSEIRSFHETASNLRRQSVLLTIVMTKFLNRQSAITLAVEISSYAKRAETHLLLFLILQNPVDRQKFFDRVSSLQGHINELKKHTDNNEEIENIEEMSHKNVELLSSGKKILALYDKEIMEGKSFQIEKYQNEFAQVHDSACWLRDAGMKFQVINVEMENKLRQGVIKKAIFFQKLSYALIAIGFLSSIIIAFVFSKKLTNNINLLKLAALEIGKGNFDVPINITSRDEVGELALYIKNMSNQLKLLNAELNLRNKELSDEIKAHEQANKNLARALAKVKQLSGFLPICASCKKIRDDKGYWNQIESYICDHSEAEFSHSICPDCANKLYSEFDENNTDH